jgi:septation ring formation regulator EzrA
MFRSPLACQTNRHASLSAPFADFGRLNRRTAVKSLLKATDLEAAQTAFHHFEEQATRLADGETRRAQLEAQNEQLARMIARSEAQAERLRSDLQRRGTHEQAVSNRQHQVRKEVSQLEAQRVAAQAHLNKAHRQIHQLNLTSNEAIPHLPNR